MHSCFSMLTYHILFKNRNNSIKFVKVYVFLAGMWVLFSLVDALESVSIMV